MFIPDPLKYGVSVDPQTFISRRDMVGYVGTPVTGVFEIAPDPEAHEVPFPASVAKFEDPLSTPKYPVKSVRPTLTNRPYHVGTEDRLATAITV